MLKKGLVVDVKTSLGIQNSTMQGKNGQLNNRTNMIITEAIYSSCYLPDIDSRSTVHMGVHLQVG